jgi:GT2 family glycosyltransferase
MVNTISIITINYNGLKDTCELLETLPLEDESLEVIVVDNASKNDEATLIEQRFLQVTVIRSEQNLGFAGGNNLGIKASHGKYLFFVNNDTVF